MGGGARRERVEIVAALERRDDAPVAMPRGAGGQPLGDPGEIGIRQQQLGERVGAMRVEAGGDQDEIGPKILERGQDDLVESAAELGPTPTSAAAAR